MNIKHELNKLGLYKKIATAIHKRTVEKDPALEMRRCYRILYKKDPDLDNPKEFVEKIYWLQLHSDTSLWTKCADKYRIREYVEECGLQEYMPKLYGKWDNADDIDFESLPDSFVLKTNNSCGTVIIVKDKNTLNIRKTRKKLNAWLRQPYGYASAQLHYLRIVPCIVAEELLELEDEQKRFSPLSLVDYKVYCINGKPECVWVAYNRTQDGVWMNLYDTEWNVMNDKVKEDYEEFYHHHPEVEIKKPECLEKMLEMATILSKPFAEVRTDFYIINGKPIIGELTFTSGTGFFTDDYYSYLGHKMDISHLLEKK